jgi:hypothetical protein
MKLMSIIFLFIWCSAAVSGDEPPISWGNRDTPVKSHCEAPTARPRATREIFYVRTR